MPKRFVTIPGRDHNDPQTPQYYQALEQFLTGLPKSADEQPVEKGPGVAG